MSQRTLDQILVEAQGLLVPFGDSVPESERLQAVVRGIELYQPGASTDYSGHLVLVSMPISGDDGLAALCAECVDAAALVLPAGTARGLQAPAAPVLLRRSPWVSGDTLIRALAGIVRDPNALEDPSEASEREAALAVRRRQSALLALLNGTSEAALPAAVVGLRPDRAHVAVAAEVPTRSLERFRLALAAEFPEECSVLSEGILLAVVPVATAETAGDVVERLGARLRRAMRSSGDLPVGIGHRVPGVYQLHESAAAAREILRALNIKLGARPLASEGAVRIASAADVDDALMIVRSGDALVPYENDLTAPLAVLADYDREYRSDLLTTVYTALEFRENISEAARQLGIHPNTLRARIDRIRELSGIDLTDPASALRAVLGFVSSKRMRALARHTIDSGDAPT
ncbi:hypothetical protein C6V83_17555 [Gordonia iterans]|uniref:PucR family transcriptional regulator n=1 Tax=Gordonia iterans TaxID=1004901 RepID=A0A2S0KJG9_9ACTN|nr:helix-turn-helix domain-containing protein [Gordonia iterans]AVM01796.1 hypothetical protein C6V83_17555 [Gordonia iterans]